MKQIKIKFVDFNVGLGFNKSNNDFIDILDKKYDIVQCNDPDYIFYSVFGNEHLKYNCTKIFYTAECYTPDFNECDYAIGYDRISFGDRYLRYPLYRLFRYKKSFYELLKKRNYTNEDIQRKTKFCNFVYSNCFAQDIRGKFFDLLSKYKRIESGGCYKNNVGGPIKNKRSFQEQTKFSIAFENTKYNGYTTEKIVEAFAAGTIPIYYGDPLITEDFNPEAFINVNNYKSLYEVIEYIKEVDKNDDLYLKIINSQPIIKSYDENELSQFLYHIFDQTIESSKRCSNSLTVRANTRFKLRHQFSEKYIYKYLDKIHNTIIRLKSGTLLTGKPKIT